MVLRLLSFLNVVYADTVGHATPMVTTPLGNAIGSTPVAGVERFGKIPYSLPPVGAKRFSQAEVNDLVWPGGQLDATQLSPPCIQNPLGDPRSHESESSAPTEDCLTLNLWRPAGLMQMPLQPLFVYLFGGGLCGGFAGNGYFDGSKLVLQHGIVVVTVQYRLGALGFMVGDDPSRPGSGGMNGIHDNIVALQWLHKYVASFGGDAQDITLVGQSSGGYSICTLCVAPKAKGLFRRASLLSGPCFGGPPSRGWGPGNLTKGRLLTRQILAEHSAQNLDDLRSLPAEKLQWPSEWMSDVDKAPYFSGYFEDPGILPHPAETLWSIGAINVQELMVSFTSKDGTAAFYGVAPTLGLVPPDANSSTPDGYAEKMRAVWALDAGVIMNQYPLDVYRSAAAAFIQADADAYVICPSRRLARYAARAGKPVWVSEFAHFQPSPTKPDGCIGNCTGFGCDNGVELDVVPGNYGEASQMWASHGSEYHFIFGTERGPDGLGPPNNDTHCNFNADELRLSDTLMAYWASFARHGSPNIAALPGAVEWPVVHSNADGRVDAQRLRFSIEATDGTPTGIIQGIRDTQCDFWDSLYPPSAPEQYV